MDNGGAHPPDKLAEIVGHLADLMLELQHEARADREVWRRLALHVERTNRDVTEIAAQLQTMLPATLSAATRAADNTGAHKLVPRDGDSGSHSSIARAVRAFGKLDRVEQLLLAGLGALGVAGWLLHLVR